MRLLRGIALVALSACSTGNSGATQTTAAIESRSADTDVTIAGDSTTSDATTGDATGSDAMAGDAMAGDAMAGSAVVTTDGDITKPAASKVGPRERSLCRVRVTKNGILVFDEPKTRAQATVICKRMTFAIITLDEGYSESQLKALRRAFDAAKIRIVRSVTWVREECMDNPLAKGCM